MANEGEMSRERRFQLAREHLLSAMVQYRQALHLLPGDAWMIAPWDKRVLLGMRDLLEFLEVQEGNRGKARVRRMWRGTEYLSQEEIDAANRPFGAVHVDKSQA